MVTLLSADIADLERHTGLLACDCMALISHFECRKEGKLPA